MATVRIPGTTLDVSTICLGSGEFGSSLDRESAFAILDRYVELGGNFVDTAHDYGNWVPELEASVSEKVIGAWLRDRGLRDRIVVATKGGMGTKAKRDNRKIRHLSRSELVEEIDESLAFLGVDQIDLYWLHRDDPREAVGDVLETLNDQVECGKIRYFGASNWKVPRIREAQEYAATHGLRGFVADQSLWNAAVLAGPGLGHPSLGWMDDGGRFDFHRETGLAMIPYQSQAYGLFKRLDDGTLDQMKPRFRALYRLPETRERYERMRKVMAETGLTITQVVLGYLIGQPFPTIPIVGCQSPHQVDDSMSAASVRLAAEHIHFIEAGDEG